MHGGKAPAGVAAPRYVHGRRSKYQQLLTGRLAELYDQSVGDPDLVNLTHELALTEARIGVVLSRLDVSLSAGRFRALATAVAEFKTNVRRMNVAGINASLVEIDRVIAAGLEDSGLQQELSDLIDLKRRLAEAQARILRDTHRMIPIDRMVELVAQVADIVQRNVADKHAVGAVVTDLARLLGPGAHPAPDPA